MPTTERISQRLITMHRIMTHIIPQDTDTNDRTMNDATEGDGILDNAVHDVTDGVDDVTDDVTDGVDKATDELTDDNGVQKDMQNNK